MGVGYKIGRAIGFAISKMIGGLCKIIWHGTVTASKENKYLLITYVCLLIALFPSYLFFNNLFLIAIILLIAIGFGIAEQFKEKPNEDRRKYFYAVFQEAQLLYKNESAPCYLYERSISPYATLFAFNSFISLSEWHKKKDILEKLLNTKILAIKQDSKDIRITQLICEMKPLPTMVKWDDSHIKRGDVLTVGIGVYGTMSINLNKYPHALICGETGSGKSNVLKCLIHQSLIKKYEVILIDFKRAVSFSEFNDKVQVYYEYDETVKVLSNLVEETKKRLDLFRESHVEDINCYNQQSNVHLKRKIIFIDELAELLKIKDKAISNSLYDSIETLARIARSAGIHLIVGIQRPDSTIVTGQIKNNIPFRLCGHFVDKEPSQIVLNNDLATSLPDTKGRFIVNVNGFQEVQCFYYNTNFIKKNTVAHKDKSNDDELLKEIDDFLIHLEKIKEDEIIDKEELQKKTEVSTKNDSVTLLLNKFTIIMQTYCVIEKELSILTDNANKIESSNLITQLINMLTKLENVKNIFDSILNKFNEFDTKNLISNEELSELNEIDLIYCYILEIITTTLTANEKELLKKIAKTNELIDTLVNKNDSVEKCVLVETVKEDNTMQLKDDKINFDFSNIKKK